MKVKVLQQFHDAQTLKLCRPGDTLEWPDEERVKMAAARGLIEIVKPEPEEKPAKKAAKKK